MILENNKHENGNGCAFGRHWQTFANAIDVAIPRWRKMLVAAILLK